MNARLLLAALAVAALAATAPVSAGTRTATAAAGDLDLGSAAGVAELERRINAAANKVCIADSHDVRSMLAAHACRRTAIRSATSTMRMLIATRQNRQQLAVRNDRLDANSD